MLEELKQQVYEANMRLPELGLVTFTWGNVSGIDREKGLFVIKPSGVAYEKLTPEDMVVVNLEGEVVEGRLNPSSDTLTHMVLYREFPEVGGIVHAHSPWAVSFAQAGMGIEAMGTTHADTFYGDVPVTEALTREEIEAAYEENTGHVIVRTFRERGIEPMAVPSVLVQTTVCRSICWTSIIIASMVQMLIMDKITQSPSQGLPIVESINQRSVCLC